MTDREKLIALLNNAHENTLREADPVKPTAHAMADYLLANGVTVLPVQPEQTVYDISEFLDGTEHPEIFHWSDWWVSVGVDRKHGGLMFLYDDVVIRHSDIGKTIFFTEEEAEAALMESAEEEGAT